MGTQAVRVNGENATRGRSDFEVLPSDLHVETREGHDLYDPRSVIPVTEGIVTSLAKGIQHKDIVCWKDGQLVRVIDGHQTVNAARELNRRLVEQQQAPRKIRITLVKFESMAEAIIFAADANKHVKSPPSVMAREILRMRRAQIADAAIKEHFGLAGLHNIAQIASCTPAVAAAVDSGRISIRQAAKISGFCQDEQDAKLAEVEAGKLLGRAVPTTQSGRPTARRFDAVAKAVSNLPEISSEARAAFLWAAGKLSFTEMMAFFPAMAAAMNPAGETEEDEASDEGASDATH